MPTTLYFAENTASRKVSGTYPTAGTNYANMTSNSQVTTEGFMTPYKWRGIVRFQLTGSTNQARRYRFGRFFSAPFAENYTFVIPSTQANAIRFELADFQSNANANHCMQQVCIYVWRPSTGQVVGTIVPVRTLSPGSLESTTVNTTQTTIATYFNSAGGSVNCLAGDILVFEPWASNQQSNTSNYTIRFDFGGVNDIVTENVRDDNPACCVKFPYDLPLEQPIGTVSGKITHKWDMYTFKLPSEMSSVTRTKFKVHPLKLDEVLNLKANWSARARVHPARMDNVPPFGVHNLMRTKMTANLTASPVFNAHLKLISKMTARIPADHRLTQHLRMATSSYVTLPDPSVGESLALYYSGSGSANTPSMSIGGPIGTAFGDRKLSDVGIAHGLSVLAAVGLADGTHTVRVDEEARTVSLSIYRSMTLTMLLDDKEDVLVIGSQSRGFVVVQVNPATAANASVQFRTEASNNDLFSNPSPVELEEGAVHYRCLYLFNRTDQDVLGVTLTVSKDTDEDIGVATEFQSDVAFVTGRPVPSRKRALTDHTGWGGIEFVVSPMSTDAALTINGLPFLAAPYSAGQESDGVGRQIPVRIDDDTDSTGMLPNMTFGASVTWPRIRSRHGVSFWVRKVMPVGGGGADELSARFHVTAEF